MNKYFHNALLGADMFANTLLKGNPGETISGRAGRAAVKGKLWGKIVSFVLDKIETDHTQNAMLHDTQRAEALLRIESQVN